MERILEKGIFASRWLLAPFYVGLVGALIILLIAFLKEFWHFLMLSANLTPSEAVLGVLSLIDLSLAANLLLIVVFSGYENFVSKLDIEKHKDVPEWKNQVDFATLKLKLVASIVAISGIHLLKIFMNIEKTGEREVHWMVIIHLVFVSSGVLLALMDYIATHSKITKAGKKK